MNNYSHSIMNHYSHSVMNNYSHSIIWVSEKPTDTKIPFVPSETFVSNEVRALFVTVIDDWLNLFIALSGIVTNILVIAVFSKQGFKDSLNITMTTIGFWDLVRCIGGVVHRVHKPIGYVSPALERSWENATFLIIYIHVLSGNVSYVMAGYVAIERCLCVSMPFKVKTLITPRMTTVVCVVISVVVFSSSSVIFFIFKTEWGFSEEFNATIMMHSYSDFYDKHGVIAMEYYKIIGIIYPVASLVVIVVCTMVMIYFLQESSKFRAKIQSKEAAATRKSPELSDRDKQVVKMLLVVIFVYIVNLIPRFGQYIALFLEPEYYYYKLYHNLFQLCVCFIMLMDFLNVSVNFFIFLTMSSNFKATFREMFRGNNKEKPKP